MFTSLGELGREIFTGVMPCKIVCRWVDNFRLLLVNCDYFISDFPFHGFELSIRMLRIQTIPQAIQTTL